MTVQQELQVTRLREQGYGYATIAKSTGLTKNAVVVFCRKKGLTGCKAANSRVNILSPFAYNAESQSSRYTEENT